MTQNVLVGTTKTTVVAAGHKMVMIQNTSGNDVFTVNSPDIAYKITHRFLLLQPCYHLRFESIDTRRS
jgi:hypothetical protein